MTPRISIIIPCYRDEAALESLLAFLAQEDAGVSREIIIVNAGPSEIRPGAVHASPVDIIEVDEPSRGAQLIAGASAARGDILWFLHADALPRRGCLSVIDEACRAGKKAGCFRFAFSGQQTRVKSLIAFWTNIRAKYWGTPYGDQGIFVERDLYKAFGGHAPLPLFEDTALIKKLKRAGYFTLLDCAIGINSRRWERDGYWRRTLQNRFLAVCYIFGVSPLTLSKWYRSPVFSRNSDLSDET